MSGRLAREVAVVGVGETRFGELFDRGYHELVCEAGLAALDDAGIARDRVEAAWLGTATPGVSALAGDAGTDLAEPLGLRGIPATRVANYCTTGMEAVRAAAFAIGSGMYDTALVVGAEKMRDVPARGSLLARHILETHPLLAKGRTAPGQFALLGTRYLETHGYDREVLASVALKNHENGARNPRAHFRKPITEEQWAKAPMVASPLGLYDCCPTTDGAAGAVLMSREAAERLGRPYVLLSGMGLAAHGGYFTTQFDPDSDFLGFPATRAAAAQAYAQAGIDEPARDLDVAECHDCFTITELVNYEDLGLCGRGQGGRMAAEGRTRLGGDIPVNTSGGLKACGHPIGATGVRMVADVVDQLLGRAGDRQVDGARRGLCHTLGGPGIVSCVMVLEAAS
ncbi:MAG TPA: acetyl-CoA acetyltransferase [Candidatus Dormibacteraeota bacterium]|nr:acetyl-CoA acetyltransferase [Candidatus Dormibacteraeota bacterium]